MTPMFRASPDDYLAQRQALLPRGAAWPRAADATITRLLAAEAGEDARAHNRALDLIEEADPRTAHEMLPEWERTCGLPDACSAGLATTLQERRAAVVEKLTARGGQSPGYFRSIAEMLGYQITITEPKPFACGRSQCGLTDQVAAPAIRFFWHVRVHGPRVTYFTCGVSVCGRDPLAKIARAEDLECRLHRLKPAHTHLTVGYEGA